MKIRSKLALRYASITAIFMLVFASVIYVISASDRKREFFDDLQREGISKANLFFEAKASPEIMHLIYMNNIEYIDEVEVAIYDKDFNLLYHDAKEIDIVKETPDLISRIMHSPNKIEFHVGDYQAIGFRFNYEDEEYAVTAAAYDGYGYSKLRNLSTNLVFVFIFSVIILFVISYYLAKSALKPISRINATMQEITAKDLDLRLDIENKNDELGELSESFNKTLEIIQSSFESQKLFVSNVSHELRTPLAALIGELDLALLKDRSEDEYKKTLLNAKNDAGRLIRILNGLLDLAKADYDEKNISMTPIRVDETLLDAREVVMRTNKDYKVNLVFNQEFDDDSELTIKANEYLLKVTFVNLIENNCKFSKDNTSNITITHFKNKVILQFADNGIGIPEEDIKNIFTPFYRGKNKDYVVGNGIGMALVKKVVMLHKGNIEINSFPDEGTTFTLTFSVMEG